MTSESGQQVTPTAHPLSLVPIPLYCSNYNNTTTELLVKCKKIKFLSEKSDTAKRRQPLTKGQYKTSIISYVSRLFCFLFFH